MSSQFSCIYADVRLISVTSHAATKGLRWEFVAELIEHYHEEADGLCCMLRRNVSDMAVEIHPRELQLEAGLLGSGEFGEACEKEPFGKQR